MIPSLRSTAVVVVSYNGDVGQSVRQLRRMGAELLVVDHCSNVTLARNLALTSALDAPPHIKYYLLADDDIVFTPRDVTKLLDECKRLGPVTGKYMLDDSTPAWRDGAQGLGFFALPRNRLVELSHELPEFHTRSGVRSLPFCQSRVDDGVFWTEDSWFVRSLGGCAVVDVCVGHNKHTGLLFPPPGI